MRVSRSDGLGIERLRNAGVPILILSKETNRVVRARAAKLGVEVLQGIETKTEVVRDWLQRQGVDPTRAAYLGNDVNDLGPMALVGWPMAVSDAHPEVRRSARLVLSRPGGHGAVRELCDLVLETRASATVDPVPQGRRYRRRSRRCACRQRESLTGATVARAPAARAATRSAISSARCCRAAGWK